MEALIKVFERLENGVERRSWLLYEALRSAPLDEAIELARKADAFIMGTAAQGEQARRAVAPEAHERAIGDQAQNEPERKEQSNPKGRLSLSADQRDRMLDRLVSRARKMPTSQRNSAYLHNRCRASVSDRPAKSPLAASGLKTRLRPKSHSSPLSRRSYVICVSKTMLSSRRRMASTL